MFDLKSEYEIIKPKYVNNDNFLYVSKNRIVYNSSNCVSITKLVNTPISYPTLIQVSNISTFDILGNYSGVNDDINNLYNIEYINSVNKYEDIILTKEMFDVLNTIVSCGITPLDVGKLDIINGKITVTYTTLDYLIKFDFSITNKSVAINSYITFDIFWYLYSLYKEYVEKKVDFIFKIASCPNGYIVNINDIFIVFNDSSLNKLFITNILDSIANLLPECTNNKNTFSKKFFIENNQSSLYKNALKCFGEEVIVYSYEKFQLVESNNIKLLIGNKKVKNE